ncbi:olfactory receptor 6N1-like [Hyla sarda]|uniref:olfactory receptor 6N1-like n=1 Tax=Hyla sarda TaxID=327740 RepID=UPI0024C3C7E6|nr:olfactory receptor 6N1-like [Hyla sarda]
MANMSSANTYFILVGIPEIGNFKYLYALTIIVVYMTIMVLSFTILYVTFTEEALHEPMYIFISNLMFGEMYGSTALMPKLVIDLLSGSYTIPFVGCLAQGFFLQSFPCVEIFTFTAMAYDRYLAVGHPLRYPMLMTNKMALKILLKIWVYVLVGIGAVVIIASRQILCGVEINSMFCETISLTHLSCGDTTLSVAFGFTWTLIMMVGCVLVVKYCYVRTFLVCLRISQDAHQKAVHTLVTHIIAFSTFMTSALFIVFRYKLKGESLSVVSHIVTSVTGTLSFALNPIIYGIRTEALRTKILQKLLRNNIELLGRGKN